jgi:hypothetical protein
VESITVAVPGRGLTKVTINTSKMQEKALAGRAMYEFAVALGPLFGTYAKACFDAFLPLVAFKYSSEIRATSAQALSAAFEAACSYGEEIDSLEIPKTYLPLVASTIATQLQEEDSMDMENIFALADSLSCILRNVYVRCDPHRRFLLGGFNLGDANIIVQNCMTSIVACLERRSQITERMVGSVSDDKVDECQTLLSYEGDLLTPLVDAVGYCLKFFRQDFIPIFETKVAPVLASYLQADHDLPARIAAVCLFDDCVEHCGVEAAAKFSPLLLEGALQGIDPASNAGDKDLVRASLYGIAQIARYAPATVLAPHVQSIIYRLVFYGDAAHEQGLTPSIKENAVSALASLVLFEGSPFRDTSYIKRETALRMFLASLPLTEDEDEAKICHAGLCDLIEHSWIQLNVEFEQVMRVIGETLTLVNEGEDIATEQTCQRFAEILTRMKQHVPQEMIHRSFNGLSLDSQAAINLAFEQNSSANVVTP